MKWETIARSANGGALPGRNELPGILIDAFRRDEFAEDLPELAVAIEDAWTGCEFPARSLDLWEWVELFDAVGYLENGKRSQRPDVIPTLYRATVVGSVGMSWTDSREQAEWFHARNRRYGFEGEILTLAEVAPVDVLAHFHAPGVSRGEQEWVIDYNAHPDPELRPVT